MMSLYFYAHVEGSWWLFIILLLLPDLSMLGYMVNHKIGSYIYNIFHTYTLPLLLIMVSGLLELQTILALGLIWTAHIGMDRTLGYGLKYPTHFKDTHMQKV